MRLSNWAARAFKKTVTNVFYSRGVSTRRRRSRRPAQQISLESLEPRQMLSVNPAISGSSASSATDNSNIAAFVSQNSIGILAVVPSAPTSVVATSGNTQLAVTWVAPANTGGSAITEYLVKYSSNNGVAGSWTRYRPGSPITATSCTVTGLTNGTAYVIKVIAKNTVGISPPSANSAPATPAAANDVTLTLASGVLTATNYADATYTINSFSYNSGTNEVSFELTGAAVITEALAAVTITGTEGTQTVTIDMADASVATTFAGLKLTSTATKFLDAHIGLAGIDLSAVTTGAANQGFDISGLDSTVDNDTTVSGAIKAKGTGDITLNIGTNPTSFLSIAAAGDITATTGSVNITARTITSNGDVTSAGPFNLSGTGDVSVSGVISVACVNALSITGDVIFGKTVTTTGADGFISEATAAAKATRIANAITVGAGAQSLVTGNLIANNSTLAAMTTSKAGNITITGNVDASVSGNNLTLVADSGAITIGGNVGSSSTAMGDLVSTGTGLFLASGSVTTHCVNVSGFTSSVTFAGNVNTNGVNGVNASTSGAGDLTFSSSITSLDNTNTAAIVLKSGSGALSVVGAIAGTNRVTINSVSGNITLGGAMSTTGLDSDILIGADSVTYSPGPPATCVYNNPTLGNILLSGDMSTTGDGSAILIVTGATGNITTLGSLTTSGGNANADPINQAAILLDPDGPGNITMKGALSTTGGGKILIGVENIGLTAVGGGNLLLDNTVTATGTVAGSIYIGVSGGTLTVNKAITAGAGGDIALVTTYPTDLVIIASGANISAGDAVDDYGPGILNLGANITSGTANLAATSGILLDSSSVNLTGAVSLKAIGTGIGSDITLLNIGGAQNLTLEATDQISLGSVGQSTPLNTVTVTNSVGVTITGNFNASVVLTDTTGTVAFNGPNTTISKLTTAAKGYIVAFGDSSTDATVIRGAPVFLNTGGVSFQGTTSLITGATITGNVSSTVTLANTIVSGGAFNIGTAGNTGVVTIADGTQLILNSAVASTIANPIDISGSTGILNLLGAGTLTLSADSSATTINDTIGVINGTLNVTGRIASATTTTSGTISGPGGTIGILAVTTGTVAPKGTLNTGTVTFNAATTYIADVLSKTTASNLRGNAGFNLGGATLTLEGVASGLATGNTFTIINNTSFNTPITGIFAGLPEGATLATTDISGKRFGFAISYVGGTDANDVTLRVVDVPSSPTAVAAVSGNASLAVTWVASASTGGSAITEYIVKYSSNNGAAGSWTRYRSGSPITATSCNVTGLTNGTAYVIKVIAKNAVGISLPSANSAPVTPALLAMSMVTVGNPGNAADTNTGSLYGAVSYSYQIAAYDVTGSQYTAFLNAVGSTDTYGLYNTNMGTDTSVAQISRSGTSGSYTYAVMNSTGSRPISYVNWFDSARFSNWMSNGQPRGAQNDTTTENGAYYVNGATSGNAVAANATNPNTSSAPTFRVPLENEWYKAAYYSPNYGGPGVSGYWTYATQSDTAPGTTIGSSANQANYNSAIGTATDVGSFSGSGSFYGTFDQSGNVYQWNDLDGTAGSSRRLRGGFWGNGSYHVSSSHRSFNGDPSIEDIGFGFRLAIPPTPV